MKIIEKTEDIPFQIAEANFTLIIFGASGSLASLKIFPALYQLQLENRLPVDYKIVGYARTKMDIEEFREKFRTSVREKSGNVDEKILDKVLENVFYVCGQYDKQEDFEKLKKRLEEIEGSEKKRVRMAYFSIPPSAFAGVVECLGAVNFDNEFDHLRVIMEKPFGHDLETAKELQSTLCKHFHEKDIYLLDHYLGKESVFNILSLRYANPILTTLIQGKHIKNIQISGMENVDIEGRGGYFDHVGTLEDMIQSHLLQILAFLSMNLSEEITQETIQRKKRALLNSLRVKDIKNSLVLGQYEGYTDEEGVDKRSKTETYAAVRLFIDDLRWHRVPIYLRSGKALKEQWTSVVIEFKQLPLQKLSGKSIKANKLVMQLQPTEKIEFRLLSKIGGSVENFQELKTSRTIYCSGDCLNEHGRLILEAIKGNKMLFLSFDEVFACWSFLDQFAGFIQEEKPKLHTYKRGSMGPEEADAMLEKDGFTWHYYSPNIR